MDWLLMIGTGVVSTALFEGPSLEACQAAFNLQRARIVELAPERAYCASKTTGEIHWYIKGGKDVQ